MTIKLNEKLILIFSLKIIFFYSKDEYFNKIIKLSNLCILISPNDCRFWNCRAIFATSIEQKLGALFKSLSIDKKVLLLIIF